MRLILFRPETAVYIDIAKWRLNYRYISLPVPFTPIPLLYTSIYNNGINK